MFLEKANIGGGRGVKLQADTENLCGICLETQPTKPVSGLYFFMCSIYMKEITCKCSWKGLPMKTLAPIDITEGLVNSLHEVSFLSPRPAAPAEESSTLLALLFASVWWLDREEK